jgi:beta-mannosidase
LNGTWKYKLDQNDVGKRQSYYLESNKFDAWRDIAVPHNWYLVDEIGDYFGTIWYHRTFSVPAAFRGQNLYLHFEGVDYISEVWVNGVYLGLHEGMFNSFEYDITSIVRLDGVNTVVVRDSAPKDPTEYVLTDGAATPLSDPYKFHQSKGISQIKGHMVEAMHRPGAMTSFRQDGNSGGLWGSVTLVAKPDIHIDYIKAYTKIGYKKDWLGDQQDKPDGTGLAAFDVFVHSKARRAVKTAIELTVSPQNFAGGKPCAIHREVVVQPGDNVFKLFVTVEDVRLWWTWDHGAPNLYRADFRLEQDSASLVIGIKEIVTDAQGQWYLNGKKIFLRGMRYISSLWMSEANETMWRADFQKMLDMDINSIRIGSHVEKDGVYRLCDELGLLMWQVFPLHYVIEDTDDSIDRAADMMRDMGYMITNHACMGMWSVYKEPEIYALPDMPNVYFRLCEVLKETLGTVDPIRWIHKGDYREGVQNIMIGSCQDGDTDIRNTAFAPNIVEFGADSVPCLKSLAKFIPVDKLWPIDWDVWEYWGLFYRNQFKRGRVELGHSLEEFIDNTQRYEALVVKEQIEVLRQRKYKPVSTMYLYYWSDACPVMGSGLLDYYREPYQVYDSMKSVYTQVLVSLEWDRTPYLIGREKQYHCGEVFAAKLWVNNDHFHDVAATIRWQITRKEGGEALASHQFEAVLKPDSAEVLDNIAWIVPMGHTGEYVVSMQAFDPDGKQLSANQTIIKACQ